MSDRKRILDKISKLLNLGNDSRGNANECATALRQAQALMAKHGVTNDELGLIGFTKESVDCPIQVSRKSLPARLDYLIDIITKAFGVHPVVAQSLRQSDYSYRIDYYGPANRVMLAVYSHTVVQRALDRAWRDYVRENPELKGVRGARAGFEIGWLHQVQAQVEAIGFPEEELEKAKAMVLKEYGKELDIVPQARTKVDVVAQMDGALAGTQFSLSRPMKRENLKIGK